MNLKNMLSEIAREYGASEKDIEEAHINASIATAVLCPEDMNPTEIMNKELPEDAVKQLTTYIKAILSGTLSNPKDHLEWKEEWFK